MSYVEDEPIEISEPIDSTEFDYSVARLLAEGVIWGTVISSESIP